MLGLEGRLPAGRLRQGKSWHKDSRSRALGVLRICRRRNDVPDDLTAAGARRDRPVREAPIGIDWGEELWLAGKGMPLAMSDAAPAQL